MKNLSTSLSESFILSIKDIRSVYVKYLPITVVIVFFLFSCSQREKQLADHSICRQAHNSSAPGVAQSTCNEKGHNHSPGNGLMADLNLIQQQLMFNLTPFVRYLKKGEGRLYSLDGQKISQQGVERRYQINIVLVQTCEGEQHSQRFKITLNRSGIINIEAMKAHLE